MEPARTGPRPWALVADDYAVVRDLVCEVLRRAGYEVVTASCGEEALERAPATLSLAVLDVDMPPGDGFQVLAELKRRASTTRVILMSSDEPWRERALSSGADGFLAKPFAVGRLVELLGNGPPPPRGGTE